MKNTGERLLPWTEPDESHYEHFHRYFFAKQFVKNKKVLDFGCGEGYGVDILADSAKSVIGIDSNEETIKHAKEKYTKNNVKFLHGSITELRDLEQSKFDIIVCFETIEHVSGHQKVIDEAKKLLDKNGLFIISTPIKEVYNQFREKPNPFHIKEFTKKEFQNFIENNFTFVKFFAQRTFTTSNVWELNGSNNQSEELVFKKQNNDYSLASNDEKIPEYIICVASLNKLKIKTKQSVFFDTGDLITYKKRLLDELVTKNIEIKRLGITIENKDESSQIDIKYLKNLNSDFEQKLKKMDITIKELKTQIYNLKSTSSTKQNYYSSRL